MGIGVMQAWTLSWSSLRSWGMAFPSDTEYDTGEVKAAAVGFLRQGWKTLPSGRVRCLWFWWSVVHDPDMPFEWWAAPSAEMPWIGGYRGAGGGRRGCQGGQGGAGWGGSFARVRANARTCVRTHALTYERTYVRTYCAHPPFPPSLPGGPPSPAPLHEVLRVPRSGGFESLRRDVLHVNVCGAAPVFT